MSSDLLNRIEKFLETTGYPFEQRVAHFLREQGWSVQNSIDYEIPPSQPRELDILAYKNINDRRVELRISCKQSKDKHWIFFTEQNHFIVFGSNLKFTPVHPDIEVYRELPTLLNKLPLFNYDRRVTNFTAFSEKKDSDARALIKDGLYSTLNSVHHRLYPDLTCDQRGTIYLFITLFNGLMFESYYDQELDSNVIKEINYTQWNTTLKLPKEYVELIRYDGEYVEAFPVYRNFDDDFVVEIIQWDYFKTYLEQVESVFSNLPAEVINIFGSPYTFDFFPHAIMGKQTGKTSSEK
jgi:hypothetical protein